ncbi:hypothetical protein ACNAW0_00370 [Micromonospora sp. SL1-18]|uniref:hypothetical protein n=1 Tax=Micromonospora sp. SL1-18 TaxID=3399128 RepID=UPI003A4E5A42
MADSTIQPGKKATADECGWFNCLDDDECCTHCGAHRADAHDPTCRHYDGPGDECDAKPDEEEPPVLIVVTSWSGGSVRVLGTREALEEYAAARVAWRYREQVVEMMLAWLADGAPSPYAYAAWHGETEFWSVDVAG